MRLKIILLPKYLCLLLLIFSLWSIGFPVEAATCKQIAGKQFCIKQIKRSAKYYWEYRVNLSINGKKQPERVYNCRFKYFLQPDRIKVNFKKDDPLSNSVCRLYQKT